MKFTEFEHLENLLRHKELVKDNSILLARRLLRSNRKNLARKLIVRGFTHDNSKLSDDLEWEYLHTGNEVDTKCLSKAIRHHQCLNRHHPEFYKDGIVDMKEIDIYEMACDFYARSQERGTNVREHIKTVANGRFHFDACPVQKKWLDDAIEILLEDAFVKEYASVAEG